MKQHGLSRSPAGGSALALVCLIGITSIRSSFGSCEVTSSSGCLNGQSFNYSDKKACGSGIFDRETVGCCHVATAFQYETEFCCYGTVQPKSVGTCAAWSPEQQSESPDCWDCSGRRLGMPDYSTLGVSESEEVEDSTEVTTETVIESNDMSSTPEVEGLGDSEGQRRRLATWPSPFPFDTIANGASPTPCTSTADDRGCYNTYTYYYSTDYVCENYLLKYSDYGCCDGIPYRVASQTCCYLDGKYVVKNSFHYCDCRASECVPTNVPSVAPIVNPTSIPTATFKPTSSPSERPTSVPTISSEPTSVAVTLSVSDDDDVFKESWLIGSIVGVAALLVGLACLQSRASSLIKERHEVALEIADTNF